LNIKPRRREAPSVDLTPLIDVVFLLLIFFMVSSSFDRAAALNINLPVAQGKKLVEEPQRVEVSIDQKGNYFINQQQVLNDRPDTIRRAIRRATLGKTDLEFLINADAGATHQSVMSVMEIASGLGFRKISFAVKHSSKMKGN